MSVNQIAGALWPGRSTDSGSPPRATPASCRGWTERTGGRCRRGPQTPPCRNMPGDRRCVAGLWRFVQVEMARGGGDALGAFCLLYPAIRPDLYIKGAVALPQRVPSGTIQLCAEGSALLRTDSALRSGGGAGGAPQLLGPAGAGTLGGGLPDFCRWGSWRRTHMGRCGRWAQTCAVGQVQSGVVDHTTGKPRRT